MCENAHIEELKKVYSEKDVSNNYILERFNSSIGRVLHEAQVNFVGTVIKKYGVKKALEVAPGPARLTVDIGNRTGIQGTIVDVNPNMLQQAETRLNQAGIADKWRIVMGDAFALPFDDIFPLVYSFRFIRHFRLEDRVKIYKQVYSHLEGKGLFIFDAINYDISHLVRIKHGIDKYPIYDKLYNFSELHNELKQNGFNIIHYISVQRNYSLQSLIQVWVDPRSRKLAYFFIKLIELARIGKPLEWIVLCQKI